MISLAALVASVSIVLPGAQPQLAAVGDRVYLTYGEGGRVIVVASADGGDTFGAPVSLPTSGTLALGMHRGPRVAATSRAVLVTAIVGRRGGGADSDILLFRSTDRGETWSAPTVINDVAGAAREGLHAMAASPSGVVVLAWLDLRKQGTRIYSAVSRDHGATWASDVLVYASPSGTVCECCHPSVAIDPDGRIAIMFRNSLDGNRDMYLARSDDGIRFTAAAKLGTGSWAVNACPMDGGSLALASDGFTATWRREDVVFVSTPRVPEQRVANGRDPVVAQFATHRDLAWSAPEGVHLMRDDGAPIALGRGRFPSLVALADKTVVAWEDHGQVSVRAIGR